jgi:hypothetical protein
MLPNVVLVFRELNDHSESPNMPARRRICILLVVLAGGAATSLSALAASAPWTEETSAVTASADAVNLAPAFSAGDKFAFSQRIDRSDATVAGGFGTRSTTVNLTATWTGEVQAADGKGTTIEIKLTRLVIDKDDQIKGDAPKPATPASDPAAPEPAKVAGGEGKHAWDSSKPEDDKDDTNPVVQSFRPVLNARFTISLDPTGRITAILNKDGAQAPQGNYAPFARNLIDVDAMRLRWQPLLAPKPEAEARAKPGDAWKDEHLLLTMPLGRTKFNITRTLASVADNVATIDISAPMELVGEKDNAAPQGSMKDSSVRASVLWDLQSRNARSMTWTQKSVLDVSATGLPVQRTSEQKIVFTRE